MARHDDFVLVSSTGLIWVRKRDGGWIGFQPMDCNASPDIGDAICDLVDDAYQRGRAETTTADRPHP